jgi:methionine-rich copper-binding protein CopC
MALRLLTSLSLAGAVLCAGIPAALAHAFLDHADPRVGSTLRAAPTEVRLWFTEPLEPAFSQVSVLDAKGERVDRDDRRLNPADPQQLSISLRPLGAGRYRVVWRVVSVDTHVTEGDFGFEIAP